MALRARGRPCNSPLAVNAKGSWERRSGSHLHFPKVFAAAEIQMQIHKIIVRTLVLVWVLAASAVSAQWTTTVADEGVIGGNVGQYTSNAIVNGNPAIAYYDVDGRDLKYVRATDASGTTWAAFMSSARLRE